MRVDARRQVQQILDRSLPVFDENNSSRLHLSVPKTPLLTIVHLKKRVTRLGGSRPCAERNTHAPQTSAVI